jgi:hypothetical protein
MIVSNELTVPQVAEAAGCNERTIRRLRSNMHLFGSVKAPPIEEDVHGISRQL